MELLHLCTSNATNVDPKRTIQYNVKYKLGWICYTEHCNKLPMIISRASGCYFIAYSYINVVNHLHKCEECYIYSFKCW